MRDWRRHFTGEFVIEKGWIFAGKLIAGGLGVLSAIVTVVSFLQSLEDEQVARLSERIATIQTGLVSDSITMRIASLKNLTNFAIEQSSRSIRDSEFRNEVFRFPRTALIDAILTAKEAIQGVDPSLHLTTSPPSRRERLQLLKTLNQFGRIGWASSVSNLQATSMVKVSNQALDLSWMATLVDKQEDIYIPKVNNLLTEFPFDDLLISMAKFDCINLEKATLQRATIEQSSFAYSNLTRANFGFAQLSYIRFSGSNLSHSNFDQAKIIGVYFTKEEPPKHCRLMTPTIVQVDKSYFRAAQINDSDFSYASLLGSIIESSFIYGTSFQYIDGSGGRFNNSSIISVLFDSARLDGASFDQAIFSNTSFNGANLRNASFLGARFQDEKTLQTLLHADLVGANFAQTIGISSDILCKFFRKQAVYVESIEDWNKAGRPLNEFWRFQKKFSETQIQECFK